MFVLVCPNREVEAAKADQGVGCPLRPHRTGRPMPGRLSFFDLTSRFYQAVSHL